jgi:outer membrane protein TolC
MVSRRFFVMTVFDAGRRRALNDERKASYVRNRRASAKPSLAAFQQVEDNLAALRILEHEAR